MIVEGVDMPEFYAAHSRKLLAHIACIALKDDENRVVNKGTATFVTHEGKRFFFTAAHAVKALEGVHEGARVLLLPVQIPNGELVVGEALAARELIFPLDVLWSDETFDVAILNGSFVPENQVHWFQLANAVRTCGNLRPLWHRYADENYSLPFAIGGYAEWGHIRVNELKLEILSALPLFAYITEWGEANALRAAQIHLEVDASKHNAVKIVASELHKLMAKQMEDADSPFGGYSGGPFVLFDLQGVHLIGIIKEGGFIFGQARAFCSAVDEIAQLAGLQ